MMNIIFYNIIKGIILYFITIYMFKGLIIEYHNKGHTEIVTMKCPLVVKILLIEIYCTPIFGSLVFLAWMSIIIYGSITKEPKGDMYTTYIFSDNNYLHRIINRIIHLIKRNESGRNS